MVIDRPGDPRAAALEELAPLLDRARRGPLTAPQCQRLVELVSLAPGWVQRVAHALSAQRDAAAVDALVQLPPQIPGVVEGLHQAICAGITRRRADGQPYPRLLALDFRRSRTPSFAEALARARRVFGPGFEALDIGGHPHYRVMLQEGSGTLAGRAAAVALDMQWLHTRLGRLGGTRLWINGWCFAAEGPLKAPIQVHLVRAWLRWAASQTVTRR